MIEEINTVVLLIIVSLVIYIIYIIRKNKTTKQTTITTKHEITEINNKKVHNEMKVTVERKIMPMDKMLKIFKSVYQPKDIENLNITSNDPEKVLQEHYIPGLFKNEYKTSEKTFLYSLIEYINEYFGDFKIVQGFLEINKFVEGDAIVLDNMAKIYYTLSRLKSNTYTPIDINWISNLISCDEFYNVIQKSENSFNTSMRLIDFLAICETETQSALLPKFMKNKFTKLNENMFSWRLHHNIDVENFIYFITVGYKLLDLEKHPSYNTILEYFAHPTIKRFVSPFRSLYEPYQSYGEIINIGDEIKTIVCQPLGMLRIYNKKDEFCIVNPTCLSGRIDDKINAISVFKYNNESKIVEDKRYIQPESIYEELEPIITEKDIQESECFVFKYDKYAIYYSKIGNFETFVEYDTTGKEIRLYVTGVKGLGTAKVLNTETKIPSVMYVLGQDTVYSLASNPITSDDNVYFIKNEKYCIKKVKENDLTTGWFLYDVNKNLKMYSPRTFKYLELTNKTVYDITHENKKYTYDYMTGMVTVKKQ